VCIRYPSGEPELLERRDSMPETPLQRQLDAGPVPPKPTPLDALDLAIRWFQEGRRIDIQALAVELGISRVTLHRWIGTREQLLAEVMWTLTDWALDAELSRLHAEGHYGGRVAIVMGRIAGRVVTNRGVRRMQSEELELLTRLTTRDASAFQRRLIARVREMLDQDRDAGHLHLAVDSDDLAFAVVRLTETFVHTPAITGDPPAPERVANILHALLDR
jgi:AcrR family transcriptional regulator